MGDTGQQIGDNRPATSSGVYMEDKDDVSLEFDDVTNLRHIPSYADSSPFETNPLILPAGKAPPPHHSNFSAFKGECEKPKPFSLIELDDLNGERMRPIQLRHVDVSKRRFDVTMLAEPSETSVVTLRPSSVSSVGRIPKPGPKVNIPLGPDEFDCMIEKMKKDAGLTDVQT
ncbi:hypothetical protein DPMN_125635 [Dreissena polymorpha]|nr:hypothetical protein DPMN_125635 [Dreissena polymorpha]